MIRLLIHNKVLLLVVCCILAIYLSAMIAFILHYRNHKRLWDNEGGYVRREKPTDLLFAAIYRFLQGLPITRNYLGKLSYHFRLISPCDPKTIARKTMGACVLSFLTSVIIFILIFLMNPQLITFFHVIVAIIFLNNEIVSRIAMALEINLDLELQKMIEQEMHYYYDNYRVDDALYQSMEKLSPNMKVAGEQIYQLLLSDDREQALKEYYENIPNKFLREFVSLCVGVAERGDEEYHEKSLFIRNMENLYTQLEIELDKLQRLQMEFLGIMMIVILPIFSIDIVKNFCIILKENMKDFYYGKTGFVLDIALLCVTSVIYVIMHKSAEYKTFRQSKHRWLYTLDRITILKRAMDNYCDKYASKLERLRRELKNNGYNIMPRHFILRSFLLSFLLFIVCLGVLCSLNYSNKKALLIVEPSYVETLTSAGEEKQYEAMRADIERYTNRMVLEEPDSRTENSEDQKKQLLIAMNQDGVTYPMLLKEAVIKEVLTRVEKYRKIHISFIDILICVLISWVAYYIPFLLLKYNATVSRDAMEDEVNQFNALIGMLMHDKSMTVKQVLIEMESYAVVFRQALQKCINDYSSGDRMALELLKEDEPYDLFHNIVDNLIRCDEMPMEKAFHEVDVTRDGYLSKRKLANEKSIRKRVIRAYFLAAVPLILLFIYGVAPTLYASTKEITDILNSLNQMY